MFTSVPRGASLLLTLLILVGCQSGGTDSGSAADPDAVESNDSGAVSDAGSWISNADNFDFILELPSRRAEVYRQAHEFWDTGVTADMHRGNELTMTFVEEVLVSLLQAPPDRLTEADARSRFAGMKEELIARYDEKLRSEGMAGGSMFPVMLAGEVESALEAEIGLRVAALAMEDPGIDMAAWLAAWTAEE